MGPIGVSLTHSPPGLFVLYWPGDVIGHACESPEFVVPRRYDRPPSGQLLQCVLGGVVGR